MRKRNKLLKSKNNLLLLIAVISIVLGVQAFHLYGKEIKRGIDYVKDQFFETTHIDIYPQTILPGNAVFIRIHATSTPIEVLFDDKKIPIMYYQNKPIAVTAIPFEEKKLSHTIQTTFSDGQVILTLLTVTPREKIERLLGIPDKLGGNTTTASKQLATNLAKENTVILNVPTGDKQLWDKSFKNPLAKIFVTDDYGYDRKTVDRNILHKGTDYRAATGTAVMAMNDGVVKVAQEFMVYGNTVIIDHGQGIQTLYMHLSELKVQAGDIIKRGDVIGLSGMTGYADAPHLHISVKVGGVSIDPEVFLGFFDKK